MQKSSSYLTYLQTLYLAKKSLAPAPSFEAQQRQGFLKYFRNSMRSINDIPFS